jgi:hypothetical protein
MSHDVYVVDDDIGSLVGEDGFSMDKKCRITTIQIIPILLPNSIIDTFNLLIQIKALNFPIIIFLIQLKKFSIDSKISIFIHFHKIFSEI